MNKQKTKRNHYFASAVVSGSLLSLASFLFTRHFRIKLFMKQQRTNLLRTENDHQHDTHAYTNTNEHGRIVFLYVVRAKQQCQLLMEKE